MATVLEKPVVAPNGWTTAEWEELVNALTRRRFITGALGLGALAVLPACGDEEADPTATAEPTTRVIESALGLVEIPIRPERVVCVDIYPMNALFDVGFTPAGVSDNLTDFVPTQFAALYGSVTKVGTLVELDLELVAALSPDLILGLDYLDDAVYASLSAIAPTALFSGQPGGANWEQVLGQFADAVGRTAEVAALRQQY